MMYPRSTTPESSHALKTRYASANPPGDFSPHDRPAGHHAVAIDPRFTPQQRTFCIRHLAGDQWFHGGPASRHSAVSVQRCPPLSHAIHVLPAEAAARSLRKTSPPHPQPSRRSPSAILPRRAVCGFPAFFSGRQPRPHRGKPIRSDQPKVEQLPNGVVYFLVLSAGRASELGGEERPTAGHVVQELCGDHR